jgi:hypothetical protein
MPIITKEKEDFIEHLEGCQCQRCAGKTPHEDFAKGGKVLPSLTLNDWKGGTSDSRFDKLSKMIDDRDGYGSVYSYEEKLTEDPNRKNNGLGLALHYELKKFGKNASGSGLWNFIRFNYPSKHKYRKWMKDARDIENFDKVIGTTDKEAVKHAKLIDKLVSDKQLEKDWKADAGDTQQHWYEKGGVPEGVQWEYPIYFDSDDKEFVAIYYSNEEDVNEADEDFDNRTYNDITPDVIKEHLGDNEWEEKDVYEWSTQDIYMNDLGYALETSSISPEKVDYAKGGKVNLERGFTQNFPDGEYQLIRELKPTKVVPEGQYEIKNKKGKKIILAKSRFTNFAKGGNVRKYKVRDEFIDDLGRKIIIIGQRLRPSGKPVSEDEWKIERRTDAKGKQRGYRSEKLLMNEQQLDTLKSFAKGGEVKKGNEMLIGGVAGILLGIFFNK